jgi:hypothetical protein
MRGLLRWQFPQHASLDWKQQFVAAGWQDVLDVVHGVVGGMTALVALCICL